MRTIFKENDVTVQTIRNRKPGEAYLVSADGAESLYLDMNIISEDALLAILLDRARVADDRKRVSAIKALKSGDDERGKAKRGPGRPKKDA